MRKTYLSVAVIILLSQGLGFLRELLFAYYQGASGVVEAFQVAETIPLLFTQLVVGSVPLAVTPLIIRSGVGDPERGRRIFATLAVMVFFLMLALSALVAACAPALLSLVAPGFSGPRLEVAARLLILLSPNVLSVSLLALFTSMINAQGNYVYPSVATLCMNLATVAALVLFRGDVYRVAAAASLGGCAALLLCALYVHRTLPLWQLRRHFDPATLAQIGKAVAPILLFLLLSSLSLVADKTIASFGPSGSVAFICYAFKVIYIPIHLFSMSFVRVMMQPLSQQYAAGEYARARQTVRKVVSVCIGAGIPLSIALYAYRHLIVELLFRRGSFSDADAVATAACIGAYSAGMVGLILNAFFLGVACSMGRYGLPVRVLFLQLPLACSLSWLLLPSLGAVGVAFGNAVAYTTAAAHWLSLLNGMKEPGPELHPSVAAHPAESGA